MKILRRFEQFYVTISMLFFTSGLLQRAIPEDDPNARWQSDIGYRIGQIIIFLILFPLLAIHWRKILRGLKQAGWIIALCGFAIASAAWSHDLRYTARQGILLSALTLFAIYVASCFDWDEQLNMFGWMSVIAVVGSCFMAVFVPSYGVSQDLHWGSVKGLFPHKNALGRQMVFAILTLALGRPKGIPNWLRHSTLAGACALLILSNSATPMIAMLVCVAMYPVLHLFRFSGRKTLPLWIPLVPVFAMGVFVVIANFGLVAEAAGRNTTLTGRIPIWNAVFSAIGRRPWLGYGYNVFWRRYSIDLAKVRYEVNYFPAYAHNGYLDILLGTGAIGLLIFLGGLVTNLWRAGGWFRANEIHGAKWPLFVLLFIAVFNLAESAIIHPMAFLWIPYVTIYVSLALLKAEEKITRGAASA
jgi:O-antigen ligase